jgi:hypothetical protein
MRTGGKTALTVRGACLAAGLTVCLALTQAEENVRVIIEDDLVTIGALNASLRDVLQELSLKADLTVLAEEVLDEAMTLDIQQASLPEAIRRLLRQKSYMLHRLSQDSELDAAGPYPHGRLWIFSDEEHDTQYAWTIIPAMRPYSEAGDETIDYRILAYSNDAIDREEAMYGLADVGGDANVGYLMRGLSDPDDDVRETAIEALMEIGGRESIDALSIVLNDPDAGLRVDAVDALGEIGGEDVMQYLQDAMADEDPVVREAAAEWLTELEWRRD